MAQKLALLVSEEKLKAFTSINQNVSPADLIPYILQSQDIVLQNYIGATYYMELKNQVVSNTVSTDNQFLLDNYIGNAMCNWGLFYALPFLKYKIFNKSVVSPTSENSDSITLEELKFLMEQVRSAGETYIKRMIEWMVLHPGNYQAYVAPRVLDGQLPERGNPYFGSLVTPKQPYAWKKRTMVGTRDSANVGFYGGTEGCEPYGMNFYQAPGS